MQLSKVKDEIWDTLFNTYFGMDSLRINFQEATNKRYFWRSRWLPLVLVLLRINFFIGKCRSRINVLSKMGLFVTARLRFQLKLLTNVNKNSILAAARVLGLPLINVFKIPIFHQISSIEILIKTGVLKLQIPFLRFFQWREKQLL